jgi:hypothetical protein
MKSIHLLETKRLGISSDSNDVVGRLLIMSAILFPDESAAMNSTTFS